MKMKMGMGLNRGGGQVFIPAQRGNLLQSLDGVWYQNIADPVGTFRMDDGEGRGNYALQNQVPEVVPAVGADRFVFTNDGTDFIDYDRPSWAVDNLRPNVDEFSIEVNCTPKDDGTIIAFARDAIKRQIQVYRISGSLSVTVGGTIFDTFTSLPLGVFACIEVEVGLSIFEVFLNGLSLGTASTGSDIGNTNLYIGGRTDGVSFNFEGETWDVKFYKGIGQNKTPLEFFALDEGTGSISTGSVLGTIGNITDGSPLDVWVNGIVKKINVNPNPTTTDGLVLGLRGFPNTFETKETLAGNQLVSATYITLNDGQRFICYNYLNGTTLLAPQNDKMNTRVRR